MKKHVLTAVFILLSLIAKAEKNLDISGRWAFEKDRKDVGITEKWFERSLNDKINLPGSMSEKLKGDPVTVETQWTGSLYDSAYYFNPKMAKYRVEGNIKLPFFLTPDSHYVGVAWYQKEVDIPADWKGERITLNLERPHIETTVWVNGNNAGMQNSLCVPHVYDITPYIKGKKCTITIRVDNRIKDINVGPDSHSITDQTQGNWNGIVGEISLKSTPVFYFDDIQVYPEADKAQARIRVSVQSSDKKNRTLKLNLSAKSFNTDKEHIIPVKTEHITLTDGSCTSEFIMPLGENMLLWDEFDPALYMLTAEISEGKKSLSKVVQFGVRKFEIKGKWFYVNGRKTMLRGTVENCCFPKTGYAPMDVESWERVFRICKSYGLNHMRFHSFCPPEAAFIAADLVGFYIQPEGPSWPNHGVKLGNGEPIDKYLMDETIALTKEYGNYASYCMLACGNEPSGRWVKWVSDFVDFWKDNDPRRVYTGASVGQGWQWQPKNQFHVKAGARGLTWRSSQPMTNDDYRFQNRFDTIAEPYVSHETGQWCAFPNFEEISKYTGVNKAKNFEIFRDILSENNMMPMANKFMMASGKLQALCYKYEIEKTLRTPDYAGFQLLALNDYSGQGTALVGVLDVFFEEKGYINAPEWRRFCSPTVPLMRTDKFTYTSNETFKADIEVSHFGADILENAAVNYRIKDAYGKIYTEGSFLKNDIPVGNMNQIGTVEFALNRFKEAKKLLLEVSISDTEAVNSWEFWVYPENAVVETGDVYVTDSLDSKAIMTLQNGGKVLITAAGKINYGKDIVQHFTPAFWNTSWFKMRPPHTTGIYVNPDHAVFKDFPTEYHSNLQWWELINRGQVMQFTDFPSDFQPLVQNIDTWFISRKIGMLFEANVFNGKLMMTTMDLNSNDDKRVVAKQMKKSILNYMNSDDFRPEHTVNTDVINNLYTKVSDEIKSYTKGTPNELKPKIN